MNKIHASDCLKYAFRWTRIGSIIYINIYTDDKRKHVM